MPESSNSEIYLSRLRTKRTLELSRPFHEELVTLFLKDTSPSADLAMESVMFYCGRIGFSTGAIAKADFHAALKSLCIHGVDVVELLVLRFAELDPPPRPSL